MSIFGNAISEGVKEGVESGLRRGLDEFVRKAVRAGADAGRASAAAEIAALRAENKRLSRPITMREVCDATGKSKLTAFDVLAEVNEIIRRRRAANPKGE